MKIEKVIVVVVGLAWLTFLYNGLSLPDVAALRSQPPQRTSFMRSHNGPVRYTWVPIDQISRYLQRAVVTAEDDQFYEHPGFDWKAIKRAVQINLKRKKIAFGASTITQQLAKNLYLSASKNPLRKFKELLIALKLERELDKKRILELYLNVAEFGPGVYGANAAAKHYFGGRAANVSPSQAAFLASILPNPKVLGRGGFRMTQRAQDILRRM